MSKHSSPVIFHIIHRLLLLSTLKKCFHKMMVHIWRNHSFLRFQLNYTIKDFSGLFLLCHTCQDHPHLIRIVDLMLFSAYKQSLLLVIKMLPGCLCLLLDFFFHLRNSLLISENFCNFLYFFRTINIDALNTTLLIQSFCPVDESPETFFWNNHILLIEIFCCNFHLTIGTLTQIT